MQQIFIAKYLLPLTGIYVNIGAQQK